MDYKLSKTEMFLEIVLIAAIVVGFVLIGWITIVDMSEDRQRTETKARCKTIGGEMGYLKCYKNGKEI